MAKVTFSESGAKRIAAATLSYERGNRDAPLVRFRKAEDDQIYFMRLGKTTAVWNKNTLANIAVYENGTPPNETASSVTLANCVNKFTNVAANKWVMVAFHQNGYYYLVSAECS